MNEAAGRLTYRDIARLTGAHPESVRRYMGRDMPSPEFIAAFCAGLGISADWLVLGRPPMRSEEALRAALARVPETELLAELAVRIAEPPPGAGEAPAGAGPEPVAEPADHARGSTPGPG